MRTGKYNLVSINSVWITSTGLNSGKPCQTSITNLDSQANDYQVINVIACDGTPVPQKKKTKGKGEGLSIRIFTQEDTNLIVLRNLLNETVRDSSTLTLKINGATGYFYLNCIPGLPGLSKPLEFTGEFQNAWVKDITVNVTVKSNLYVVGFEAGEYQITGNNIEVSEV